jgi:hypothetical protein
MIHLRFHNDRPLVVIIDQNMVDSAHHFRWHSNTGFQEMLEIQ